MREKEIIQTVLSKIRCEICEQTLLLLDVEELKYEETKKIINTLKKALYQINLLIITLPKSEVKEK